MTAGYNTTAPVQAFAGDEYDAAREARDERWRARMYGNPTTEQADRAEPDAEEREAAFLEAHPEISAVVPSWADEVELDLDALDINGSVMFTMTRTAGTIEIDTAGRWHDGTARLLTEGGYGLWFTDHEHNEPTPEALAAYARRVAADLLNAADVLDEEAGR